MISLQQERGEIFEMECSEREILINCTWLDGDSQGGLPLATFQIGARGKKSESSPGRFFRPFLDGTQRGPPEADFVLLLRLFVVLW